MAAGPGELPGAVLFACTMNAVRSPMAAAILRHLAGRRVYVDSAGVRAGAPDPFVDEVMDEIGIDMSRHRPHTHRRPARHLVRPHRHAVARGAPPRARADAHHGRRRRVLADLRRLPALVGQGSREQMLDAYRIVRDALFVKIKVRFGLAGGPSL